MRSQLKSHYNIQINLVFKKWKLDLLQGIFWFVNGSSSWVRRINKQHYGSLESRVSHRANRGQKFWACATKQFNSGDDNNLLTYPVRTSPMVQRSLTFTYKHAFNTIIFLSCRRPRKHGMKTHIPYCVLFLTKNFWRIYINSRQIPRVLSAREPNQKLALIPGNNHNTKYTTYLNSVT